MFLFLNECLRKYTIFVQEGIGKEIINMTNSGFGIIYQSQLQLLDGARSSSA